MTSYEFVGIDFGTSTVYLTASNKGAPNQVLRLTTKKEAHEYINSAVGFDGTRYYCGSDLQSLPKNKDSVIFRSLKNSITNSEKRSEEQDLAMVALLKHVRELAESVHGIDFSKVSSLKFGCPAVWDVEKRTHFIELVTAAGFKKVTLHNLREEPIAAGLDWAYSDSLKKFSDSIVEKGLSSGQIDEFDQSINALVFDMGGGTLDLALIRIADSEEKSFSVLASCGSSGDPGSGTAVAGDQLDHLLSAWLKSNLGVSESDLDQALSEQLLDQAKAAKERLTTLEATVVGSEAFERDTQSKIKSDVNLTRGVLNDLLDPIVDKALRLVDECVSLGLLGKRTRRSSKFFGWLPNPKIETDFFNKFPDYAKKYFPKGDVSWERDSLDRNSNDAEQSTYLNDLNPSRISSMTLRKMGQHGRAAYVDVVVLVGGMSKIPRIKERLSMAFPNALVLSESEETMGDVQVAVARGLGLSETPSSFDAFRPPFQIVLEDADGKKHPLLHAYQSLVEMSDILAKDSLYGVRSEFRYPEVQKAKIHFERLDGVDVKIEASSEEFIPKVDVPREELSALAEAKRLGAVQERRRDKSTVETSETLGGVEGIPVNVGPNVPLVVKVYLNGQIYIRDSRGIESKVIISWPEDSYAPGPKGKSQHLQLKYSLEYYAADSVLTL